MDMTARAFVDMPASDHGLKIFSSCPVSAQAQSERCIRELQEFVRASEGAGHEGALVFTDNSQLDPWLVSQIIVESTERLCPLVAIQPAYMHPYSVAKIFASISRLSSRRPDTPTLPPRTPQLGASAPASSRAPKTRKPGRSPAHSTRKTARASPPTSWR